MDLKWNFLSIQRPRKLQSVSAKFEVWYMLINDTLYINRISYKGNGYYSRHKYTAQVFTLHDKSIHSANIEMHHSFHICIFTLQGR